jgi:threonine/homoserine/homoserine lactone efflux protein
VTSEPSFGAYVAVTALLVATPGASAAVVVRSVLQGGRSAGMAAALGIAAANTAWATAAGVGVTAIFTRAPVMFSAIRFAGAGYLFFLGALAIARALRASPAPLPAREAAAGVPPPRHQVRSAFRDGVAVNLLNPPVAMFYIVIVPSFLPPPAAPLRFVLYAALHVGLAFLCHAAWAAGFDRLRAFWSRPAARRALEAITGAALVALAWRMLE